MLVSSHSSTGMPRFHRWIHARPALPGQLVASEVITLFRQRWTNTGRLVLFVAEGDGQPGTVTAGERAGWHERALAIADVTIFWWPDDHDQLRIIAALAICASRQRVVYGTPAVATLDGMVTVALGKIGAGARRTGGEREVPLEVWWTELSALVRRPGLSGRPACRCASGMDVRCGT